MRAALGLAEGAGIAEAINNNAAETSEEENTITEDSDPLADFNLPEEETPVLDDTLSADADSDLPDMDFDLPEENTSTSDVTLSTDADPLADFSLPEEDSSVSDDTISADADSDLPDMDFDLPAPDSDSTSLDSILDDDLLADSSESNTIEEDSTLPDLNFDLPETVKVIPPDEMYGNYKKDDRHFYT